MEDAAPAAHGDDGARVDERRAPRKINETHAIAFLSCCGIVGLGAFAGLMVLLNSIHTLGPEDQVLVEGPSGKYVRNGPSTVVLAPERRKIFRQATRLSAREYAVVKNTRSGEYRHHIGPDSVFLGPWEMVEEILKATLLQRDEYIRLVDQMTGGERVISGPKAVVPKPLESSPKGVEKAVILGLEFAVLIRVKTTGMLQTVNETTNGGGIYIPRPYEDIVEVRKATVLAPRQYAVIKSHLDGGVRHVGGPRLFQVGAYEELVEVKDKFILRKDEYIRLRNKKDGSERVVRGPQTFIPEPSEQTLEGKQRATFLDLDTSALVLNRATGQQHLVTERGVFVPSPYEQVLEKRPLIRVLPHEAMVVRSDQGHVSIIEGGGTDSNSFFLKPYWKVLEMTWSSFSENLSDLYTLMQTVSKVAVTRIDMRSQKMFFRYTVFTSDNVKLVLDGAIFWHISSVGKMVNTTSDPSGDVWHHARSALIQAVSKATLANFMLSLTSITAEAFETQAQDGFYTDRGVEVESIEISRFEVADPKTGQILHDIIKESTTRINRLQKQASSDEVRTSRLGMDIQLERKRTELVICRATNERLKAEMAGDMEGLRRLGFAQEFIGGLNTSVPSLEDRLDLYKQHIRLESKNIMTRDLAAGGKRFFLTPKDLDLSLKIEL